MTLRSPRRDRRAEVTSVLLLLGAASFSCGTVPGRRIDPARVSPDLEPFLHSYFASWSRGDMNAYSEHFHSDAVIFTLRDGRVEQTARRGQFVAAQSAIRARAAEPPVERMLSFTADEDDRAATVVAQWELHRKTDGGDSVVRGVDRFTLMRDARGRWAIVSLVFYASE